MKFRLGRICLGAGATAFLFASLTAGAGASGAASGAVPFSQANFHGYATGTEVHLGVLNPIPGTTTNLAGLDQAFSGASTATGGLTNVIKSETSSIVQPAEGAAINAYGRGSGLEVGIGTSSTAVKDPNQVLLAGLAESTAPPIGPAVTKQIGPININPVANASLLTGRAATVYDTTQCPIGQPISYGFGNAANVNLLNVPNAGPVLNTAGHGTSVAQTTSYTILTPNGDGAFGLSSVASDIIAPITVNILGQAQLLVSVHSAGGVNNPVTLTAKTTGESTGAAVNFSADDLLTVDLVAGGTTTNIVTIDLKKVQKGGVHIPLSTDQLGTALTQIDGAVGGVVNQLPAPVGPALGGALTNPTLQNLLNTIGTNVSQVTSKAAVVSLGSLDIDTTPHAIGKSVSTAATVVGGTEASGALDLVHLNVALSGSINGTPLPQTINVANLYAGHLETSANLAQAIDCGIPVIKSANPTSVQAGHSFTYTIQVPDPAKIALLACDLTNMTVTDTISDEPNHGDSTFQVTSASNNGVIHQTSPNNATVTWTGLNYKVAPVGSPPNPPISLSIGVQVPSTSPSGTIQDVVVATATAANCNGGVTGIENVGGVNGTVLSGSFTLLQPSVTAAQAAAVTATTLPAKLPFTGAMGGVWQPIAGVAVLGLGGGSLALVRRVRRRMTP